MEVGGGSVTSLPDLLKRQTPIIPNGNKEDAMVIAWIIENIDGDIVNQFLDYTTAHSLWQGIESRLGCGRDELQIFDLSGSNIEAKQRHY